MEYQERILSTNERAVELRAIAEQLFGVMTSPWRYAGVIFQDHPPHLNYAPESTEVRISLSLRALEDDLQRDFQLAHEICHLLYPSVEPHFPAPPETTALNEGISTYFSLVVVAAFNGEEAAQFVLDSLNKHSPKYFSAYQLVSKMLKGDTESIKKLRVIQPMINSVVPEDFHRAGIQVGREQISALLSVC